MWRVADLSRYADPFGGRRTRVHIPAGPVHGPVVQEKLRLSPDHWAHIDVSTLSDHQRSLLDRVLQSEQGGTR